MRKLSDSIQHKFCPGYKFILGWNHYYVCQDLKYAYVMVVYWTLFYVRRDTHHMYPFSVVIHTTSQVYMTINICSWSDEIKA